MINVMLIDSAKSRGTRRASHQSAFISNCLNISHTCLPCLPSGRTLLFLSDLFVVGREVSWERWESSELRRWERGEGSELGRWERYVRVVRWQGGKGGRIVRWQGQRSRGVVRWQDGNCGRVARWQGGRFLVLFKVGRRRVGPTFHLFVFDINPQNEGAGCVQDFLAWLQVWKDSP